MDRIDVPLLDRVQFHDESSDFDPSRSVELDSGIVHRVPPPRQRLSEIKPGLFIRLDAIYNVSRHKYGGLAVERSDGLFPFIDLEGAVTPYLCWRRTEGHAFIPQALSLDSTTPDIQPNHRPREAAPITRNGIIGQGIGTPRIHPFNSDRVEDWLEMCKTLCPLGVELLVSTDPETDSRAVGIMVNSYLQNGGDLVCPLETFKRLTDLHGKFKRVETFGPLVVALGKTSKTGNPARNIVVEDMKETRDPLRLWVACHV